VAIGHRAFFRREGEIVDALIVREPGTTVELFDLGVFENRDTVLVSSGHGGSLFLWGHGTHLFVHRADADSEAARHVFDANFGLFEQPHGSAACRRNPRLCGVVNGIRTVPQRRESNRPHLGFDTN